MSWSHRKHILTLDRARSAVSMTFSLFANEANWWHIYNTHFISVSDFPFNSWQTCKYQKSCFTILETEVLENPPYLFARLNKFFNGDHPIFISIHFLKNKWESKIYTLKKTIVSFRIFSHRDMSNISAFINKYKMRD